MKIFTGTVHPELAREICAHLGTTVSCCYTQATVCAMFKHVLLELSFAVGSFVRRKACGWRGQNILLLLDGK